MIRQTFVGISASAFAAYLSMPVALAAAEIEIEAEGPVVELSIFESVTAEPDLVTIGAGVSTQAPTAVEALRQNAEAMRRVIDEILAQGVAEEDIQTTGINLNAQFDYDRETRRQIFRGYQVSNRVSVKLRDIEGTGEVLDALVSAGATDLSGPSFSIEDDQSAKDIARARAVERASQRARAYAAMVGYDDVRVLEISETISTSSGPIRELASADASGIAVTGARMPVQPGLTRTGVAITIKYEMIEADEESLDEEEE